MHFKKQTAIHGASGFTLLELIISLTILGVVLLIIFGALRIGTRAWEKGEKDIAVYQRQRAVLGLLSQQIASACVHEIKWGDDAFYFRGSEKKMEFVSRMPIVPGALTGVVFVKYEIEDVAKDGKMQLRLFEKDAGFMKDEDIENQRDEDFFTLISGIENLQFEYLKSDKDDVIWQNAWDPSETEGMPLAVRIVLKQDEQTAPIRLIIPVRCQQEG
ncbi:MAG: prepilin-type N-terminal cleavage/methylation domain-containing protein [Deltaproteobacteria bacterium]|nr:prepilin-type N-terminal cleavage/methylation domain-containing protein [Deltaproteobacteria bacterium]